MLLGNMYESFILTSLAAVSSMVTMRKLLVALVLVVMSVSGAYAQDVFATTPFGATKSAEIHERVATRQEQIQQVIQQRREEIQSRIELRREEIATRVAEVRRRLTERRRALIRRFFGQMLLRFKAAIARMRRLANRIESRLDKMQGRGIDVADLRDDLEETRDNIAVAEGLLDGLEERLEEALASDDSKAAFEVVRDTIYEVRDSLKEIHHQLVVIITQMKASAAEAAAEATPSAESSE